VPEGSGHTVTIPIYPKLRLESLESASHRARELEWAKVRWGSETRVITSVVLQKVSILRVRDVWKDSEDFGFDGSRAFILLGMSAGIDSDVSVHSLERRTNLSTSLNRITVRI
jgi:hypothetical protein